MRNNYIYAIYLNLLSYYSQFPVKGMLANVIMLNDILKERRIHEEIIL